MKRSLVISLVVTVAITSSCSRPRSGPAGHPKLGLDLAGGSEIVYKPAHTISSGEMNTTINIIRNRVDGAGVSGATVDSQGGNVVVQFPGVKNPQALIKLIGTDGPALLPARAVRRAGLHRARQGQGPARPARCPSCGQYATTAANLTVNTDARGQPANNIPPDPAFAAVPVDHPPRRPQPRPCCSRPTRRPGRSRPRFVLGPSR